MIDPEWELQQICEIARNLGNVRSKPMSLEHLMDLIGRELGSQYVLYFCDLCKKCRMR